MYNLKFADTMTEATIRIGAHHSGEIDSLRERLGIEPVLVPIFSKNGGYETCDCCKWPSENWYWWYQSFEREIIESSTKNRSFRFKGDYDEAVYEIKAKSLPGYPPGVFDSSFGVWLENLLYSHSGYYISSNSLPERPPAISQQDFNRWNAEFAHLQCPDIIWDYCQYWMSLNPKIAKLAKSGSQYIFRNDFMSRFDLSDSLLTMFHQMEHYNIPLLENTPTITITDD
jgi:hypothetical protein